MTQPFTRSLPARAAAVAGVSLALGLLSTYLLFDKLPGLSFPIFVTAVITGLVGLSAYLRQRLDVRAIWLIPPIIGLAAMVAVRDSALLTLINIGACLVLLLALTKVSFRRRLTDLVVSDYLKAPLLPLRFIRPALVLAGQLVISPRLMQRHPRTLQVIKGLALSLPVLAAFGLLFISADLVFQRYATSLFTVEVSDEVIVRSIVVVLATLGLFGAYSYSFGASAERMPAEPSPYRPKLGTVESTVLLASVNALFLAFIPVQLIYLFGGEANISALGLTYAEYARKGFFELLLVALGSFGLLWLADTYVAKTDHGHFGRFKFLSSVLIAQVIVIMGSAFWRLYLYEQAYGFTTLRLYSHAFTVLLAVIFIILAYKIIRSAPERAFALPALVAVVGFVAILNALNPDAFIARQNLERYRQTGKLDAAYLSRLSADAAPVLARGAGSVGPDEAATLNVRLRSDRGTQDDWRSWNYSRAAMQPASP